MSTKTPKSRPKNQVVGNVGLYYVCYRLSQDGWNVMPTARNARGVDIVAYDQRGKRKLALQVKSLSKQPGVPLGESLDNLIADFVIICSNVAGAGVECSVMTPREIRRQVVRQEKNGKASHWLPARVYLKAKYYKKWQRIGSGL